MPFATIDDIKRAISDDALKALTDDFNTDQIQQDIVNDAINKAEGFLAPLLPLSLYSEEFVKPIEIELALYFIYMRLGYSDYATAHWEVVNSMMANILKTIKNGIKTSSNKPHEYYTRKQEFTEDLISKW